MAGWNQNPAIAVDGLQRGLTGSMTCVGAADPAVSHQNQGWNVVRLDGSARWWRAGEMPANALPEYNTFSDGGGHTGCMAFWSTISGFTLP